MPNRGLYEDEDPNTNPPNFILIFRLTEVDADPVAIEFGDEKSLPGMFGGYRYYVRNGNGDLTIRFATKTSVPDQVLPSSAFAVKLDGSPSFATVTVSGADVRVVTTTGARVLVCIS